MPLILMTYGAAWFVLVSVEFRRLMGWLIKVGLLPSRELCPSRGQWSGWKVFPRFCSYVSFLGARSA